MGATDQFLQTLLDAIKPDEQIGIAGWAAKHRILPADSPEPGRWRNERTPYLVGIMDALSGIDSNVTRYAHDDERPFSNRFVKLVGLQKGHQLGGSALGENFIGRSITSAAGNILAVFATNDDAEKWEMDRFEAMRKSTPELRKRIGQGSSKDAKATKRRKRFPGGMLNLVSATRAGRLKSTTVRYVLLEEIDEYELNVDGQGNPIDLALNRTSNFGRRAKIFANSTPTIKGRSHIEKLYQQGDQRRYFMRCPCCGHPQYFEWKHMRWSDDDPESVVYHCQGDGCGVGSPEHLWKTRGFEGAYWMPTAPGDGKTASFHLSALYAPMGWRPWPELVRDWIAAQKDIETLIAFVNNELAECWQDRSREVEWEVVKRRAIPYALRTIPLGCLLLTMAVDTQNDRLEVTIDGWGRGMVNWTIDHVVIHGDPATPGPWEELDKLRAQAIENSFGVPMRAQVCGIDSGGSRTQDVYDYCRLRQHEGVFALKGAKERHKPIIGRPTTQDVTIKGKTYKNGVKLWPVGTDTAKDRIFGAFIADAEATDQSAYRMRFSTGLSDEYFQQLVSEAYNPSKDRWDKLRPRNEALDLKVYNLACAYHPRVRLNLMTDADWTALEAIVEPKVRDLFAPAPAAAEEGAPLLPTPPESTPEPALADGGDWLGDTDNWLN
ncbi:phage terminase large subunit family protein [Pandoraea sputorum]|uniref:phage terminase large subunit family protein n=1 Tax=Pandoraea sputorum TaxID=93222 RepID=UPI002F91F94C